MTDLVSMAYSPYSSVRWIAHNYPLSDTEIYVWIYPPPPGASGAAVAAAVPQQVTNAATSQVHTDTDEERPTR